MERLTKWDGKHASHWDCHGSCENCDGCCGYCASMVDRLAAIEDILGDEYDLDRLRELAQADKEGRCVVLPCKIEQRVYDITSGEITEKSIVSIPFLLSKSVNYLCMNAINQRDAITTIEQKDIGKTVFLTREAAEAALRREQDG